MKVYSTAKELWESQGAEVAGSIQEPGIDLLHLANRNSEVDSFSIGILGGTQGDFVEDLKSLAIIRYAFLKKIPVVASGNMTQLLARVLGHSVIRYAIPRTKKLKFITYSTGFAPQEEREMILKYDNIETNIDPNFSVQIDAFSEYHLRRIAVNESSQGSTMICANMPHKALLFQPNPETLKKEDPLLDLFWSLVEKICLKGDK
jgi:hypothetical protein